MKKQDKLLDDLNNAPPKKNTFIKVLLITGIIALILLVLDAIRFIYQFKDSTEL